MTQFRKVATNTAIIKAKDLQPGSQLIGTYVRTEEGKWGKLHLFDTEKGLVMLGGTNHLNWQLEKVSPETLVRVTYLGMRPPHANSKFQKESHGWEVEVAIPDKAAVVDYMASSPF